MTANAEREVRTSNGCAHVHANGVVCGLRRTSFIHTHPGGHTYLAPRTKERAK